MLVWERVEAVHYLLAGRARYAHEHSLAPLHAVSIQSSARLVQAVVGKTHIVQEIVASWIISEDFEAWDCRF